jgi:hypothetical protein
VLIVDEAAMVDTQRTKDLLQAADQMKARVVFAGDERQLASIEAGGMFGVFAKEFGEAELSTVYRQREDWQKDATRAFAQGDTAGGMQAYADHGAIQWSDKRDEAAAHLVQEWVKQRDQQQDKGGPRKTAFVFAHSNANVDSLNTALQAEQIKAGLVKNPQEFTTERGKISVGEGDRLQFRANDKPNGVYNGSLGTVEKIDGESLSVRLDSGGAYRFDANTYTDFQLGYAGTVYRGQGKTIDTAFVLYSAGMDKKAAYVAMTRAREETKLFAAREDAADLKAIVRNIDSRKHYGASLNYAAKEGQAPPPLAPTEAQRPPVPQIDQAATRQAWRDAAGHAATANASTARDTSAPAMPSIASGAATAARATGAGLKVAGQALEAVGGILEGLLGLGSAPSAPPSQQDIQMGQARAEAQADAREEAMAKARAEITRMRERERQRQEQEERQGQSRGRSLRRERDE